MFSTFWGSIMRFKLQLVLERDEPEKKDITLDIATFDKDFTRPEHIGLSISDAKNILQNLQKNVVNGSCGRTPKSVSPELTIRYEVNNSLS